MKKILALVLAALLVVMSAAAFAEVYVKVIPGKSSNYRENPSLDGEKLGALKSGETLIFGTATEEDDRGVVWYAVELNDGEGTQAWMSSRYTTLTDGNVDGIEFSSENMGVSYKAGSEETLAVSPEKGIGDATVEVGDPLIFFGCTYTTSDGTKYAYVTTMNDESGWVHADNMVAEEETAAEDTAAEAEQTEETGEKTVTLDNGLTMTYDTADFDVGVNEDNSVVVTYKGGVKAGISILFNEQGDAETAVKEAAEPDGAEVEYGPCFGQGKEWYYAATKGVEDDYESDDSMYARNTDNGMWTISTYFFTSGDEDADMACSDAIEAFLNTMTFAD